MVARMLNLCGLYLGPESDLLPPSPDNPEGFWEHRHFVQVNDEILARLGGAWDVPPPLPAGWETQADMSALRAEAAALIAQFDGHPVWGWKDPRNALTLAFWKSLLPNLKVVLCLRNPVEVVQSLHKRGVVSDAFGFSLWLTYNQSLLALLEPDDRVITHYDAYFHDPQAELRRLRDLLNLPASDADIARACAATAPDLRHHRIGADDLMQAKVPLAVLQAYVDLCAQAGPVCQHALERGPAAAPPQAARGPAAVQQECFAQLFGCNDGRYSEERSIKQVVHSGAWQTVRFTHVERVHTDGRGRLRVDPVNTAAFLEVANIRVVRDADNAVIYSAETAAEAATVEFSGDLQAQAENGHLLLMTGGFDPQIYLPPLGDFHGGAHTLEMSFRLETTVAGVARGYHRVWKERHELAETAQQLRARVGQWESAETVWRQMHAELRGAVEASRAECGRLESQLAHHVDATARLQARTTQLEAAEAAWNQAHAELRAALEASRAEGGRLELQLALSTGEKTRLQAEVAELHRVLAQRAEETTRLQRDWQAQLDEAHRVLELRAGEAARRQRALETAADELNRALANNAEEATRRERELEAQVAELRNEGDALRGELQAVHASASWKLTTPLRSVQRFLAKQRRSLRKRRAEVRELSLRAAVRLHPTRRLKDLRKLAKAVRRSQLVDEQWYRSHYKGIVPKTADPVLHYLREGVTLGCDPNPFFASRYYLQKNPDVAASGVNPLVHYFRSGWKEGRDPSLAFSVRQYLQANPDVAGSGLEPLAHYLHRWRNGEEPAAPHSEHAEETNTTPTASPVGSADGTARRNGRRNVLVVDFRTLTPDHDSGSLRMFNLLTVLQSMGCSVTFVPDNLDHPERHIRKLEHSGITVLTAPQITSLEQHLREAGPRYDLVVLSRLEVAVRHIDMVRSLAPQARVIFDTVDLHFLRQEREARFTGDAPTLAAARECKTQELAVARRADVTLVVSGVEKRVLEQEAPGLRVSVVSNIQPIRPTTAAFEDRHGFVFIGGFDHTPNVDALLFFVEKIFPRIHAALPDATFQVIGTKMPPRIAGLRVPGLEMVGYVPDLVPYFNRCRLSVAPLRFGAGVKGKVNASMAHGVPVVATSVAAEGMELVHEVDVLIADAPDDFAAAVVRLYRDKSLWTQLSRNGMENVKRHFSFEVARASVDGVLTSLFNAHAS
jgi:glycosyltransferase involved in cell wall biosynthesis